MSARPPVITDQAISTTASSSALAHGPAGVITMAGVAIATEAVVVERIPVGFTVIRTIADAKATPRQYAPTAEVVPTPDPPHTVRVPQQRAATHPMVLIARQQRVVVALTRHLTPQQRIVAALMEHPTPRHHMVAALMEHLTPRQRMAANPTVVDPMMAADINNW